MSEKYSEEINENVPDAAENLDFDANKMSAVIIAPQAPVLRIEQIKDVEGNCSEDDGQSQGEGSDAETVGLSTSTEEFVAPDDELRDKIIKQAEFYFSDANILKDAFLLKHVRRNKQGFVSLKLITSFKKMKSLTKDYRIVAYSLSQSENLIVNEEGTKVCRKDPLPEYDETTPSRTVVAVNLPMDNPTIENVAELFSKCGDITLIRILKPGKSVPADIKKHCFKHPEIGTAVCAVVEFESFEQAKKASELMTNNNDWRGGLRVALLAMNGKKNKDVKDNDKLLKPSDNKAGGDMRSDANGSDVEHIPSDKKKKTRRGGRKKNHRLDELSHDSSCYSSGSDAEGPDSLNWRTPTIRTSLSPPGPEHRNHLSPKSSPNPSPHTSPRARRRGSGHGKSPLADNNSPTPSPQSSPGTRRKKYDYSSGDSNPSSPWVQRRMKAAQELSPLAKDTLSPGASPLMQRRHLDGTSGVGVIRMPRGPDGTRGFQRVKPRSDSL